MRRRRATVAVALVAAIAFASRPAASQESAPPRIVSSPRDPLIGVNADLTHLDDNALHDVVARMAAARIRAVRQPVRWSEIEPQDDVFDWSALDRVVDALVGANILVLATIETSPDWARRDPPPPEFWFLCPDAAANRAADANRAPPTHASDLAYFAFALANRYGSRVWAVEVWREPNILPNWRRGGPDPEDYGYLLATVANVIHGVAPRMLVVSAGLAPTTDVGVCYMSDVVFLARLARAGALADVDAVGIEPFGLRDGPEERPVDRDTLGFSRAELLKAAMRRAGVDRPLWAVAWGWNARLGRWDEAASPWGSFPPETAAQWLRQGWSRARADWPWLGPMFVWQLQPDAPADDPASGFALLDAGGRPTVLWDAVAAIAEGRAEAVEASPSTARPSWQGWMGWATASGPSLSLLRWATLAALAAMLLAVLALMPAVRRRAGPMVARLMAPPARWPARRACLVIGALVAANMVGPAPLGVVAPALLVVLAAAQPLAALAATAALLPFYYGLHMWVVSRPVSPFELMLAVTVAGRLARWYAGMGAKFGGEDEPAVLDGPPAVDTARRLDALVVVLVAWSAASIVWSDYPGPAIRQWRTVIVEPAILYGLLRSWPDRRAAARWAVDGLVAGGVIAAIWALAGVAASFAGAAIPGVTGATAEGVIRAMGPYGSPNNLALYLGRLVPVVVAVVVLGNWGARRRWTAAGGAVLALALVATFSRGLIVAGLPALALYGLAVAGRRARRMLLGIGVAAAVLALLAVPFAQTPRVRDTFRLTPGTTLYIRVRLWESALEMACDHPWLGVGLDNFLYHYRDFYVQRDVIQDGSLNHPHNWLLDWWTRLGLPGLAIWLAIVAGNLRLGWRCLRRRGTLAPGDAALAVGALGMQVYALAHGLVDNSFFLVDLAAAWWIAQAALAAVDDVASSRLHPPSGATSMSA